MSTYSIENVDNVVLIHLQECDLLDLTVGTNNQNAGNTLNIFRLLQCGKN